MSNTFLYSFCSYTYVIPNNQMYPAHSDCISSARTKIEFLHELIQLSQGLGQPARKNIHSQIS